MTTCLHKSDMRSCWHPAVVHGYCREHAAYAPEERAAVALLSGKLRNAREAMERAGNAILRQCVIHSSQPGEPDAIPADLAREYSALFFRHHYLETVQINRRPGDALPAEVTME